MSPRHHSVDDLDDIGELEKYIAESAVILLFLSKGYFQVSAPQIDLALSAPQPSVRPSSSPVALRKRHKFHPAQRASVYHSLRCSQRIACAKFTLHSSRRSLTFSFTRSTLPKEEGPSRRFEWS